MSSPSTALGTGPEREPPLHEDWLNGIIPHPDLILPVVVARNELQGLSHIQALSILIHFYGAAKEWQAESGIPPRHRSLDDCEPWEASDGLANDAVDLARRVLPGRHIRFQGLPLRVNLVPDSDRSVSCITKGH